MKTVFLSVFIYFIGISLANAYNNISLFHPWILQACIKNCSWTIWFNTGKPHNSTSGDSEDTAAIIVQHPETMCENPIGMEVQSINYQTGNWTYEWRVIQNDGNVSLVSFYSTEPPGVDFRVRYCCPEHTLISTTTIPTSSENSTCGIQEVAPRTDSILHIVGEIEATANSWPWMVYLHKSMDNSNKTDSNGCSAILIDELHLITVAHCIEKQNY